MSDKNTKESLSTKPYKGVRDFYPEDMFVQNYIFDNMRKTVESFGYIEYGASILEPSELYKAKSGEEIVNEQTYTFKDRGDRDVTLRPEMTPTVTRMVAARKRELSFPLRWYSIPNLFRYEKPQRGRLREHFQLNVDLFGVETISAEVEVISVAYSLMRNFGADDESFTIKISSRQILNYLLQEVFTLDDAHVHVVTKLIDKKNKITAEEFKDGIHKVLGKKTDSFIAIIDAKSIDEFAEKAIEETSSEILGVKDIKNLIEKLQALGIKNAKFDPTITRGFDYYTGVVFEVFDTSPQNNRSLFGGGRYDDLLSVFGTDRVPTIGFGMGDVTARDFLETYNLLPKYRPNIDLAICTLKPEFQEFANVFAIALRKAKVHTVVDITNKKVSQQIQWADKNSIPYIICIGENEMNDKVFSIKELSSDTEYTFHTAEEIAEFINTKK